jgi:hypothetical protein
MGSASGADAVVVDPTDASKPHSAESILLAEVSNPFGLALQKGIDLNSALKDDPTVGGDLLDTLVEEVRLNICSSLKSGADGIFYRLHGACPKHCSPMQYGGHYLERDRELLSTASAASLNVLFVAGHEELYIDFVSDLPANVFAWDRELTQVSAGDVRSARIGATASSDPTSEITLLIGRKNYLQNLEQPNIG